jgi:hypothetical protein
MLPFCNSLGPPNIPFTSAFSTSLINNYLKTQLQLRGTQIFRKPRSNLKILGAQMLPGGKFHTEFPQVSGTTIYNVVAKAAWHPEFVSPKLQHHNKYSYFNITYVSVITHVHIYLLYLQ